MEMIKTADKKELAQIWKMLEEEEQRISKLEKKQLEYDANALTTVDVYRAIQSVTETPEDALITAIGRGNFVKEWNAVKGRITIVPTF